MITATGQQIEIPTKTSSIQDDLAMLKNFVYVSIISADNDDYTEEVKQEVIKRRKESPDNWEYILEPLGEDKNMYIKIFRDS